MTVLIQKNINIFLKVNLGWKEKDILENAKHFKSIRWINAHHTVAPKYKELSAAKLWPYIMRYQI